MMNKYETVADLKNCVEDIVIFGAGKVGGKVINLFKDNNIKIACICDNNKEKHGTLYHDIEVLSLDDIITKYEKTVFIICIYFNAIDIVKQLDERNISNYYLLPAVFTTLISNLPLITKNDITQNFKDLERDKELLKTFKDKHLNERCFIIGNGPSLTATDLDKLKNEYTFAVNFIYKIFDQTDWRPTYYTTSDLYCVNNITININSLSTDQKFSFSEPTGFKNYDPEFCNIQLIHGNYYPNLPNISSDMINGAYHGHTITYSNIQLALHLGFKEIIFLGIDHNYTNVLLPNKQTKKSKNIVDHFYDDSDILPQGYVVKAALSNTTLAYEKAKQYADENGIKMLNATRGGKLEVFERVDFDTLF